MNMKKLTLMLFLVGGTSLAQPDQITVLEPLVVRASPIGELRFDNRTGRSGLGDIADFANTPRSVSTLDSTVMDTFNITSISEVMSYVSNVQTVGSFGDFVSVNVRGDLAETYVNGQRRSNNSFGFQPSFNGVESLDVVHGAPSVVFGPGYYSGGYVNLLTKKAYQTNFTNVRLNIGTITPAGDNFLNVAYQVDTNLPINKSTAIRVSYEGQNNETFYHRSGGKQNNQDVFFTLNRSTQSTTWDITAEYSHQNTPEQIGVNRVTQTLIDRNLYQSGTIGVPYDTSVIANGKLVHLNPTSTLMNRGDFAKADVLFGQSIFIARLSPSLSVQNYSLAEYVDRGRVAGYGYNEFVRQTTLDNRTELHFDTEKLYTIIGLNARYEERKVEVNYLNTYFNAFDVSKGGPIVASSYFDFYIPGTVGMGGEMFFGPKDYVFDTTQSWVYTVAPFIQQRMSMGKFQFIYGLRADHYNATVNDPLQHSARGSTATASASHTESLIYNVNDKLSFYLTYGRMSAINATVTGGGIVLDPDLTLSKSNFHSKNELFEGGARWQTERTSFGLTGFWQYRQQHNFYANSPDNIVVRGIELEYKAQPMTNLFFITNLTYQEANVDNSFPFEWVGNGLPAATEEGNYRIPGLSRIYANQSISYRFDNGFGVGLTGQYQSEQSGDALGGYHIPAQYSINARISYTKKTWGISLNVNNVTNRLNWVHNGDFYGDNVVIGRELPINASLTITKKF